MWFQKGVVIAIMDPNFEEVHLTGQYTFLYTTDMAFATPRKTPSCLLEDVRTVRCLGRMTVPTILLGTGVYLLSLESGKGRAAPIRGFVPGSD